MTTKYPCVVCSKNVKDNHKAVCCDICNYWTHTKCNHINNSQYAILRLETSSFYCNRCLKNEMPFSTLSNSKLFETLNDVPKTSLQFEGIDKNEILKNSVETLKNIDIDNVVIPYCNPEELNQLKIDKDKSLGILHLNISSIASHIDDLIVLMNMIKNKFHIICITESRIKKGIDPTTNIHIPGYSFEHVPTESSAGGVLIYISNSIQYKPRFDLNIYKSKELESIFLELIFPKRSNIIVGCIYKHPLMKAIDFNQNYLESLLSKTIKEKKPVVLAGDFNFNLLNVYNHKGTSSFIEEIFSHNFIPRILHPTRITSSSATVIDNIFLNTEMFETVSGNITASLSDHLPQFIFIKDFFHKNTQPQFKMKRDFSNYNSENFLRDLGQLNWDEVLQINTSFDISRGFQILIDNFFVSSR